MYVCPISPVSGRASHAAAVASHAHFRQIGGLHRACARWHVACCIPGCTMLMPAGMVHAPDVLSMDRSPSMVQAGIAFGQMSLGDARIHPVAGPLCCNVLQHIVLCCNASLRRAAGGPVRFSGCNRSRRVAAFCAALCVVVLAVLRFGRAGSPIGLSHRKSSRCTRVSAP